MKRAVFPRRSFLVPTEPERASACHRGAKVCADDSTNQGRGIAYAVNCTALTTGSWKSSID